MEGRRQLNRKLRRRCRGRARTAAVCRTPLGWTRARYRGAGQDRHAGARRNERARPRKPVKCDWRMHVHAKSWSEFCGSGVEGCDRSLGSVDGYSCFYLCYGNAARNNLDSVDACEAVTCRSSRVKRDGALPRLALFRPRAFQASRFSGLASVAMVIVIRVDQRHPRVPPLRSSGPLADVSSMNWRSTRCATAWSTCAITDVAAGMRASRRPGVDACEPVRPRRGHRVPSLT